MIKKTVIYLVIFLLTGLLQSCSTESDLPQYLGDTGNVIELTLADANQPVFALIYIAKAKGYFTDVGLNVTYQKHSSGRDALNSLLSNKADVATVYETPIVIQAFDKKPMRILSTLHSSERNTGLAVRHELGEGTLQDVVGKRIAVPFDTNAQFFLNQFLTSEGISLDQITFVDTKPQDSVQLFLEGKVDAVAAWNPNLYNAKNSFPATQVHTYYSDLYTEMSMLVTTGTKLQTTRQAYLRLLHGIKKAEGYLIQHPEESKEIVIKELEPTFSRETIDSVWEDFTAEYNLSNSLFGLLSQEAEWMKKKGIARGELPNFRHYIDTSLLLEVNPGKVTLLNQ